MILPRRRHLQTLTDHLQRYPVVVIFGARRVGKTILARQLVEDLPGPATVFDLENPAESQTRRRDFIRAFLERDLPRLDIRVPSVTLQRFWTMLAHYHGQIWNGSELARAFGVGHSTVRRYLDTLSAALVVRQLQP